MDEPKLPEPGDLLAEKSLWAIWSCLRKSIKENWFNKAFLLGWLVIVSVHAWFATTPRSDLLSQCRSLLDAGIGFGSSILGFLIAGFTIFATMSRPEMLLRLASTTHKESGLSWLKYTYFGLVEVFITYLVFVISFFVLRVLTVPGGGSSALIHQLPGGDGTSDVLAKILFAVIACAWMWTLLKLKSFVFNIYHVVMAGIAWDVWSKKAKQEASEDEGIHAVIDGERVRILEMKVLDNSRTEFKVMLESSGEVKVFIAPPATVTQE